MATDTEMTARVTALCKRLFGESCTLENLVCLTGGASKTTYALDAVTKEATRALILQVSQSTTPREAEGDVIPRLSACSDAAVQQFAQHNGVPVPEIVHVLDAQDGIGTGYVSRRIDGETLGGRIARGDAYETVRPWLVEQCARALAALHTADTRQAQAWLPQVSAHDLLERFRRQVDRASFEHPALEWALSWLSKHVPDAAHVAVCHGDFRNGNFIVGPDGLRAVLDWELASLGDPTQDLGWLCVRSWRFGASPECGGFGSREALIASYRKAGGRPVAMRDLLYWEAFGNVRWALHCLRRGIRHRQAGRDFSVEDAGIARRLAEPLYDFFQLVKQYG